MRATDLFTGQAQAHEERYEKEYAKLVLIATPSGGKKRLRTLNGRD